VSAVVLRELMRPCDREMWAAALRQAVEDLDCEGEAFDEAVRWFEQHPELALALCLVTGTHPAALYTYVVEKCQARERPSASAARWQFHFRGWRPGMPSGFRAR
jgi:hypothetical protein